MHVVPLGEVAKIDRVGASHHECQTLPYVGLEHIEKESGRFVDDFRPKPESLLATKFKFTPQHVLYGKLRPYLNKVALPPFSGVCTTEILPILPLPTKLERGYLYAFLLSSRFVKWASENVSGANLPRLDPGRLLEFEIPLRPLPEQKRIAAILEQADRLRRIRRYVLELGVSFLQSVFLEMFGEATTNPKSWDTVYLGDVIVNGPQNGIYKPASAYGTGTPILRIDAFYRGSVEDLSQLKRLRLSNDEMITYGLYENDIVINRVNSRSHLGKSALIPVLKEPTVFESNMMRIAVDNGRINSTYLLHFLQTNFIKNQIQVCGKDAVNQASINQEDVKALLVRVPPPPIQQAFAVIVRRFDRLRQGHRESLRHAEHLFQTLLHRAFTSGL